MIIKIKNKPAIVLTKIKSKDPMILADLYKVIYESKIYYLNESDFRRGDIVILNSSDYNSVGWYQWVQINKHYYKNWS